MHAALLKRLRPEGFAPEYAMAWKLRKTPGGWSYPALIARQRKPGEQVGWPTPNVPNGGRSTAADELLRQQAEDGRKRQLDLNAVAQTAEVPTGWPTPIRADARIPGPSSTREGGQGPTATVDTVPMSGWPTPTTEGGGGGAQSNPEKAMERLASGRSNLDDACHLAGWATPSANSFEPQDTDRLLERRAECAERTGNGNGFGLTLGQQVQLNVDPAGWPTPTVANAAGARDATSGRKSIPPSGKCGFLTLVDAADMAGSELPSPPGWATPAARDFKSEIPPEQWARDGQGQPLSRQAMTAPASGTTPSSSTAATGRPAGCRLNPAFSLWLMGYPMSWLAAGVRAATASRSRKRSTKAASCSSRAPATRSTRSSPPRSSSPTARPTASSTDSDPSLPYQRHSDTSKAAAVTAERTADIQRERVFRFISGRGDDGATDDEVQVGLGLSGNAQRPRRRELEDAGRVRKAGRKRPTQTGSPAEVWVAVNNPGA